MGKHSQSIDRQILDRMVSAPKGTVFSAAEFMDLGSRAAIDQALSRNFRLGLIRKVSRGLYDCPVADPMFGPLSPRPEAVVQAVAARDATRLQVSGGAAANALGLSDQVPMRIVYLTDGRARRIQLGKMQIVCRKASPRQMATAGRISGTVIQALRWLGRAQVDDTVVSRLRKRLPPAERRRLLDDLRYAPAWIAGVMRRLAEGD